MCSFVQTFCSKLAILRNLFVCHDKFSTILASIVGYELCRPEKKLNLGGTQLHNSIMVLFKTLCRHCELCNCVFVYLCRLKLLALGFSLQCFTMPNKGETVILKPGVLRHAATDASGCAGWI